MSFDEKYDKGFLKYPNLVQKYKKWAKVTIFHVLMFVKYYDCGFFVNVCQAKMNITCILSTHFIKKTTCKQLVYINKKYIKCTK